MAKLAQDDLFHSKAKTPRQPLRGHRPTAQGHSDIEFDGEGFVHNAPSRNRSSEVVSFSLPAFCLID